MKKLVLLPGMLILVSLNIILSGCSVSNKISSSYLNPDATKESIKFNKVAVFALVMKNSTRRVIEDAICSKMINRISVASYEVIDDDDLGKPEIIKPQLIEKGFDGALILRLVDVENRESYSAGYYPNSYYTFGGYYGYSWGVMYTAGGTYRADQLVSAEINIYSLKEDKLIWSGETISINPNNIEKTIAELSVSVRNQLIEDGLLDAAE